MSNPPIALTPTAEAVSYLASGERLHAELGASSAHQWSVCTASIGAQRGRSRPSTEYSRWGTVNHLLSADCLAHNQDPEFYEGWTAFVKEGRDHQEHLLNARYMLPDELPDSTYTMVIDQEHIECSKWYVDMMRKIAEMAGAKLYAEIRVPVAHITGEYAMHADGTFILDDEGRKIPARGTADCIIPIVKDCELVVGDLKGGEGVKVDAYRTIETVDPLSGDITTTYEPNKQLSMYASGALRKFRKLANWKTVRLMIIQPRLNHVSEHVFTVQEIEAMCSYLSGKAEETRTNPVFAPSYKTCQFCSASGDCAAQSRSVAKALDEDFEDIEEANKMVQKIRTPSERSELDSAYALLPFIRSWCDAVADRMHQMLLANGQTERFKLVAGDKGHRYFKDEAAFLETYVDGVMLTEAQAFTKKMISPAQLETLLKKRKQKWLWEMINNEYIAQPPAKNVIAPIDDPREAIDGTSSFIEDMGEDGTGSAGATNDEDFEDLS